MLSAFKQMMKDYGEQFDFVGAGLHRMAGERLLTRS
jgi:hypothetical protein